MAHQGPTTTGPGKDIGNGVGIHHRDRPVGRRFSLRPRFRDGRNHAATIKEWATRQGDAIAALDDKSRRPLSA